MFVAEERPFELILAEQLQKLQAAPVFGHGQRQHAALFKKRPRAFQQMTAGGIIRSPVGAVGTVQYGEVRALSPDGIDGVQPCALGVVPGEQEAPPLQFKAIPDTPDAVPAAAPLNPHVPEVPLASGAELL